MAATSYAIVTAAYNEAAIIEHTLRSMEAQTVRPELWVLVSDGSTDGTDEIARRYAARMPFLQVMRIDRDPGRTFVSKVHAVRAGFARLAQVPCAFVGNLDADLSFGPDYFAQLLQKFAADPLLGVGGGWIHERGTDGFEPRRYNSREWVPHAVQLLRRGCYEAIGDYVPLPYGGEDTCAVIQARMAGWRAESFTDLAVLHHRRTSSAGGVLRNRFRTGMMDHSLGYHPAYELVKCARRLVERPYAVGSAVGLAGFAAAALRRQPRPVSGAFVDYIRREQMQRFSSLFTPRRRRPSPGDRAAVAAVRDRKQ